MLKNRAVPFNFSQFAFVFLVISFKLCIKSIVFVPKPIKAPDYKGFVRNRNVKESGMQNYYDGLAAKRLMRMAVLEGEKLIPSGNGFAFLENFTKEVYGDRGRLDSNTVTSIYVITSRNDSASLDILQP